MVFPSLQLALALSCVMGLVMFARYCGEDHSHKLPASQRDAVSVCVRLTPCIQTFSLLDPLGRNYKSDGTEKC